VPSGISHEIFCFVHKGSDERGPIFAAADMEKDLVE